MLEIITEMINFLERSVFQIGIELCHLAILTIFPLDYYLSNSSLHSLDVNLLPCVLQISFLLCSLPFIL